MNKRLDLEAIFPPTKMVPFIGSRGMKRNKGMRSYEELMATLCHGGWLGIRAQTSSKPSPLPTARDSAEFHSFQSW